MNQSEPASDFRQDGEGKKARRQERRTRFKLPLRAPASDESPRINCPATAPQSKSAWLDLGSHLGTDGRSARPHHRRRNGSSGTNGRGGATHGSGSLQGGRVGGGCESVTCLGFPFHGAFRCSRRRPIWDDLQNPSIGVPRSNSTALRQCFRFGPAAADGDTRPAAVDTNVTLRF